MSDILLLQPINLYSIEKRVDKAGGVETKERDERQCPERGVGN